MGLSAALGRGLLRRPAPGRHAATGVDDLLAAADRHRREHRTTPTAAARRALAGPRRQAVSPERALADELEELDDPRDHVIAVDMAVAARITSLRRLRAYALRQSRRRRGVLEAACELAEERSDSPRESAMRLVWVLDAGLPRPVCNRIVYSVAGEVLGKPDLLDPVAGVVGEYDGAAHRDRERHRTDVGREDRFRRAGLECFTVVAGDSRAIQVERMLAACERAASRSAPRLWTIDPPAGAWHPREPDLDAELDARDTAYGITGV
jgi:hypothetical protein